MGTTIFYFSSTGNSLKISRDMAKEMNNAVIVPIVRNETLEPVGGAGESIGFIDKVQ